MIKDIPYADLDRHFKAPKSLQFCYKRLPRKLKKKIRYCFNHINIKGDINIVLWYTLEFRNPNYKRFLIKQICKV